MKRKTKEVCCVTDHMEIPEGKLEYIRQSLREEVAQAIEDGFTCFLSGCGTDTDLEFAKIVANMRDELNLRLFLEIAFPYAGWLKSENEFCKKTLARANGFRMVCEEYSKEHFFLQNREMILCSDRVIAVFDGQAKEAMVSTINYAITMNKDIRYIAL